MTVDRFGNKILSGWAAHEILYLKAAMELPRRERFDAFSDIAGITGRTVSAVQSKAYALHSRALVTWAESANIVVAGRQAQGRPTPDTWILNQPTRAMLMAGRAPYRKAVNCSEPALAEKYPQA